MAWTLSHLVTSVRMTVAEAAPPCSASATTFPPWPSSISAMVRFTRSFAKASAMARPMLEPPPVTMTLFPSRLRSIRRFLSALPRDGLAAVQIQGLASHEVRGRRREIDRERPHFLRFSDAARRHLGQEQRPCLLVSQCLPWDVGVHVSGSKAVHLDPVTCPLGAQASRERFHGRLAGAVGSEARDADRAVHRADVDDLAAMPLNHPGHDRAGQTKHRREVGGE